MYFHRNLGSLLVISIYLLKIPKRLRWSRGSVLAFGTRVQTQPKQSDFSGEKNPQCAFLRRGSKAVGPMSYFTACKRTQKWRGSRHFRQNSRPFLAHSSTFRCWGSLASFQTQAVPCGESWNVLITGPPSWGFDVLLATALCKKTFLLRRLNDSWVGQNPAWGCSADWRRRGRSINQCVRSLVGASWELRKKSSSTEENNPYWNINQCVWILMLDSHGN